MENNEVETDNTQTEVETNNTQDDVTSEKTHNEIEPTLTKEQKSKLDSFDRIYAENKTLKANQNKSEPKEKVEEWIAPNNPLDIVKLSKSLEGYSEEETEHILAIAKGKYSNDIEGIIKATKDPMVQFAIGGMREKSIKENKIPSPSSASGGYVDKSPEDIEKMNRDDHKKFWKESTDRLKSEGI